MKDIFSLWQWIDTTGLFNEIAFEGRTAILRGIWIAKTILASQYTFTPTPTVIRDLNVLTYYGLDQFGRWIDTTNVTPAPTLKMQIGLIVMYKFFNSDATKRFQLSNTRAIAPTYATMDWYEVEFFGISDLKDYFDNGFTEATFQGISAKWAERVRA